MQFPHGTTIAVSDGRTLRLFTNRGTELHLALEELPPPDVHGREESAARHGHTGQDNKDRQMLHDRRLDKDDQEDSFCAAVAAWLNHEAVGGRIQHLMVIAPPRALGALRPRLDPAVTRLLIGELAKEHTHDTLEHLEAALKAA